MSKVTDHISSHVVLHLKELHSIAARLRTKAAYVLTIAVQLGHSN
jgi:hypothetical protein